MIWSFVKASFKRYTVMRIELKSTGWGAKKKAGRVWRRRDNCRRKRSTVDYDNKQSQSTCKNHLTSSILYLPLSKIPHYTTPQHTKQKNKTQHYTTPHCTTPYITTEHHTTPQHNTVKVNSCNFDNFIKMKSYPVSSILEQLLSQGFPSALPSTKMCQDILQ